MSAIPFVLFGLILVGILLVIVAYSKMDQKDEVKMETTSVEASVNKMKDALEDAELMTEELSGFSKSVFEELDARYQEILYLYSLIDEKKNEVATLYNQKPEVIPEKPLPIKKKEPIQKEAKPYENQISSKIAALKEKGYAVSQIAKELNMGQGEVSLFLELLKVR